MNPNLLVWLIITFVIILQGDVYSQNEDVSFTAIDWHEDKLVFSAIVNGNSDVWMLNLSNDRVVNLTSTPTTTDGGPIFSPDGEWIAFKSANRALEAPVDYKLWIVNILTGEQRNLTPDMEGHIDTYDWSPDGQSIVYTLGFLGETSFQPYSVWVTSIESQESFRLSPNDSRSHFSPVWSPDGQTIAFVTADSVDDLTLSSNMFVTHAKVRESYIQVTEMLSIGEITWSPDGDQVVALDFSHPDMFVRMVLISLNDNMIIPLTNITDYMMFSPRFSPDGSKIAFIMTSVKDRLHSDLVVVDPEHPELMSIIGDGIVNGGNLAWSDDSDKIVFISAPNGKSNLGILDLETGDVESLTIAFSPKD